VLEEVLADDLVHRREGVVQQVEVSLPVKSPGQGQTRFLPSRQIDALKSVKLANSFKNSTFLNKSNQKNK
jgi:hypothetical protein